MGTSNRPLATKKDWERHKHEIETMLLRENKKLSFVKKEMAKRADFPHATENMWKKQIKRWGFDMKNHKPSTIKAAAAHYQACLDNGQSFYYASPGCKPVTEQELKRYLKRRNLKVADGQLVDESSLSAEASASIQSLPSAVNDAAETRSGQNGKVLPTSPARPPIRCQTEIHIEDLDISDASCDLKHHPPSVSAENSTGSLNQHHSCLEQAQMTLLQGHRYVTSPCKLFAPQVYAKPETFLLAFDVCIVSSYTAGLWDISESFLFVGTRCIKDFKPNWSSFDKDLQSSSNLSQMGKHHKARRLFFDALKGLSSAIAICMPLALSRFASTILHCLENGHDQYAKTIIVHCSSMFNGMENIYPGLGQLFGVLRELEQSILCQTLEHAMGIYMEDVLRIKKSKLCLKTAENSIDLIAEPQMNSRTTKPSGPSGGASQFGEVEAGKETILQVWQNSGLCAHNFGINIAQKLPINLQGQDRVSKRLVGSSLSYFMLMDPWLAVEYDQTTFYDSEDALHLAASGNSNSAFAGLVNELLIRLSEEMREKILAFVHCLQRAQAEERKELRILAELSQRSRDCTVCLSHLKGKVETMPGLGKNTEWIRYTQGRPYCTAESNQTQNAWHASVPEAMQEHVTLPVFASDGDVEMGGRE